MFSIKLPANQINCIYAVVRPLYIGARIFGFFPFSAKIQLDGKKSAVYFTSIDCIIFVVHLTIYASVAYINMSHNYLENPTASYLLIFGTRILLVLGLINGIICISSDLFNRNQIFNIFDQCQYFDVQVMVLLIIISGVFYFV